MTDSKGNPDDESLGGKCGGFIFIFIAVIILVIAMAIGLVFVNTSTSGCNHDKMKCLLDVIHDKTTCRPKCAGKEFSLFGMDGCHPWLDCKAIDQDVQITDKVIGGGAVKVVKLGLWRGYKVAVSFLRDEHFSNDFLFNIQMLEMFNTDEGEISDHVVQLLGYCSKSPYIVVTEFHSLGSADGVRDILINDLPAFNTLSTLFSLCLDFVHIIQMLHNHVNGSRVLCDANDLKKTLSQFLVSTELHLLLNDMDALPIANESGGIFIKCGHRELYGDFVAPEQMWPYEDLPFNDSIMPGYTESIDIWKIPDIFNYLLDDTTGSNKVKLHLFNIHMKCKNLSPQLRPSASEVLHEYEKCFKLYLI